MATPDIAWQAYDYCGHLLAELGLEESLSKACPPATIQTCLGEQFDTVQMTLSVTPTRLTEIETLLSLRGADAFPFVASLPPFRRERSDDRK